MKSVRGRAALAVMSLGMAGAASANLLDNGGFEDIGTASPQASWNGYTYGACGTCSPILPGWEVPTGNVDIVPEAIGNWKPAHEGDYSLDLVGYQQGTISQAFATVKDASYTLSFWYSKNVLGSPNPATATVSLSGVDFGGWTDTLSVVDPNAGTPGAMNWIAFKPYTFMGTGNDITLTFAATNAQSQGGVFIDTVSVVPEPEAYGLALAGMGVVAFAMRRGRRQP